ncbi:hypothetical protein B0J13DRAFT_526997 [Dactylonectria estremocensis]|uniref:Uncharacterized protein n=1 Tax=Dactylonectria estremocensis TaxID=1079267 RepID=A0A9P9ENC6_9HYPO|nr:hypothetical protein B0J13DRAFT_526997 [Dactylonectria estremocensis]
MPDGAAACVFYLAKRFILFARGALACNVADERSFMSSTAGKSLPLGNLRSMSFCIAAQDGYWISQSSKFLRKTLAGCDFQDVVGPVGPINCRLCQLQAQGCRWVEYVRSIKAITVFGNNFGELLELDGETFCPNWGTDPENKDYMSASIGTLKLIHTSANAAALAKRTELLQVPSTCLSITLRSLGDNGAVVFGHTPYKGISWLKKKGKTDEQVDTGSLPTQSCTGSGTLESLGENGPTQFEMSP